MGNFKAVNGNAFKPIKKMFTTNLQVGAVFNFKLYQQAIDVLNFQQVTSLRKRTAFFPLAISKHLYFDKRVVLILQTKICHLIFWSQDTKHFLSIFSWSSCWYCSCFSGSRFVGSGGDRLMPKVGVCSLIPYLT